MKKHIMTALLITTMISMTACGGKKNTDTPAEETVVATEATVENPTADTEKVVLGTVNKEETTTAETTADAKPKSTETPKTTTKPNTQTSATTTATTKPNATTAPKSTTAPAATATPKATQAPAATAKPVANTPAPTAAPVACQHTNTHVESSHDTYQVPISGGCVQEWRTATRVCNDCGANLGEAPDRVGDIHHGCIITEGISATCTTDGRTAVCGCDCGGLGTTGGEIIPAFGHDYHDVCTDEISEDLTQVKWETVCYICGDVAKTWWE